MIDFLIRLLGGATDAEVTALKADHEVEVLGIITAARAAARDLSDRRYCQGAREGYSKAQSEEGTAAAERDGYRSQLDLSDRMLKIANKRLEGSGLMPVTSFFC